MKWGFTPVLQEVWQRGIFGGAGRGPAKLLRHREYIAQDAVKAGSVDLHEKLPCCLIYLAGKSPGAKAREFIALVRHD
jgi:hypothetical protein